MAPTRITYYVFTLKLGLLGFLVLGAACATLGSHNQKGSPAMTSKQVPAPAGSQSLVLGGGCFWCVEAVFQELKGVVSVESGYAGGDEPNPTYKLIGSGRSRHAEVVKVVFNPKEVSAEDLLRVFFTTHDPTTKDRQGNDVGPQYRSVIFFSNDAEKARAQKIIAEVTKEKLWPAPIVTTLEPLKNYGRAEEYHQDYFSKFEKATPEELATMNSGYCQFIVEPKVRKFRAKFADKLRRNGERAP